MGQCIRLFNGLKAYQAQQHGESASVSQPAHPVVPVRSVDEDVSLLEDSSTPVMPVQQPPKDPSPVPAHSPPRAPSPARPRTTHSEVPPKSTTSPGKPLPKEFPIDKLLIAAAGMQMINTGEVTIGGKTAISNAVVALMQQYSTSTGYVDRHPKHMAATALVEKYPTLRMGMNMSRAADVWHRILSQKLINWRKRGKVDDPKMAQMQAKYRRTSAPGENAPKKQKQTLVHVAPVLSEEEVEEQEHLKQNLKTEMSKPIRTRNIRLLDLEMAKTFPLRRRTILTEAPHVRDLIREWPSLKVESTMLKEFSLVNTDVADFHTFSAKLESILAQLVDETRAKATAYTKSHPLPKIVSAIPWIDNTEPDFDMDLNIIGALAGLCYLLPPQQRKLERSTDTWWMSVEHRQPLRTYRMTCTTATSPL